MTLPNKPVDADVDARLEVYRQAGLVNIIGIIINCLLAVFKIFAGIIGHSSAVLTDGIHTASDLGSSAVIHFGFIVARRKPDEEHPYGHGKAESIAAKLVSIMLFVVGVGLLLKGSYSVFHHEYREPTFLAVWAATISVIVKELLFHYKIRKSRELSSSSLAADAWHHRSDAFSSMVALIGVLGAKSYPVLDSIGAIGISIIIIAVAIRIFLKTSSELMDGCTDSEKLARVHDIAEKVEGVLGVEKLRIRKSGLHFFVDIHVNVNPESTVLDGHRVACIVRDTIRRELREVADVLVHVEPFTKEIPPTNG